MKLFIYLLSKLLPLLFLPLGIALFLIVFYLYKRNRWSIQLAFSIIWIFSLGVISNGLLRIVEHPWKRLDANLVNKADAIVVLSSSRHLAPGEAKIIEWVDPDRFLAGIELYKYGKAPRLMFTGGSSPLRPELPPEGSIYITEAKSRGIPLSALSSTNPVVNTAQEAIEIKALLDINNKLNPPVIHLITSAFHMKRAQKLFERQGIKVLPFPVDFKSNSDLQKEIYKNPLNWIPDAHSLYISSKALREIMGRIVYKAW